VVKQPLRAGGVESDVALRRIMRAKATRASGNGIAGRRERVAMVGGRKQSGGDGRKEMGCRRLRGGRDGDRGGGYRGLTNAVNSRVTV
jgi:hypothetical protein